MIQHQPCTPNHDVVAASRPNKRGRDPRALGMALSASLSSCAVRGVPSAGTCIGIGGWGGGCWGRGKARGEDKELNAELCNDGMVVRKRIVCVFLKAEPRNRQKKEHTGGGAPARSPIDNHSVGMCDILGTLPVHDTGEWMGEIRSSQGGTSHSNTIGGKDTTAW